MQEFPPLTASLKVLRVSASGSGDALAWHAFSGTHFGPSPRQAAAVCRGWSARVHFGPSDPWCLHGARRGCKARLQSNYRGSNHG